MSRKPHDTPTAPAMDSAAAVWLPLSALRPNPRNPRAHGAELRRHDPRRDGGSECSGCDHLPVDHRVMVGAERDEVRWVVIAAPRPRRDVVSVNSRVEAADDAREVVPSEGDVLAVGPGARHQAERAQRHRPGLVTARDRAERFASADEPGPSRVRCLADRASVGDALVAWMLGADVERPVAVTARGRAESSDLDARWSKHAGDGRAVLADDVFRHACSESRLPVANDVPVRFSVPQHHRLTAPAVAQFV